MATRPLNITNIQRGIIQALWDTLTASDTDGDPVSYPDHGDWCVQVSGNFGTSGEMTLQGSNDGSNWYALTDKQGNDITFTAAGIASPQENPRYIRPAITAGSGSIDLDVTLIGRRNGG